MIGEIFHSLFIWPNQLFIEILAEPENTNISWIDEGWSMRERSGVETVDFLEKISKSVSVYEK